MLNFTLLRREVRGSLKAALIFIGVLAVYFALTIPMYDPAMEEMLTGLVNSMPEIMSMFGMAGTPSSLIEFVSSYLYGFLMAVFPLVFTIMCANRLVARHVDRGSMAYLLAAPVKRITVVLTQMLCLVACVCAVVIASAGVGLLVCQISFPGELDVGRYALLNAGLLCLHMFIAGVCFFFSCLFNDSKYSLAFGAGIPALSYVIQMASTVGSKLENLKYASFFSLYMPDSIAAGKDGSMLGSLILLVCAVALFAASCAVFCKKDMYL